MRGAHPNLHAPAAELRRIDNGCLDASYDYARAPGELSHLIPTLCEDCHAHLLRVACQVVGSPRRLRYESTASICSNFAQCSISCSLGGRERAGGAGYGLVSASICSHL